VELNRIIATELVMVTNSQPIGYAFTALGRKGWFWPEAPSGPSWQNRQSRLGNIAHMRHIGYVFLAWFFYPVNLRFKHISTRAVPGLAVVICIGQYGGNAKSPGLTTASGPGVFKTVWS